jgi:uncharacterized membrane protein YcjF (UPF0283 family)
MKSYFKIIGRVVVLIGLALLFLVALEALRAYQTLDELHPIAGYAFIGVLIIFLIYLIWQIRSLFRFRAIPRRPEIPETGTIPDYQVNQFYKYMVRLTNQFSNNPYLSEQQIEISNFQAKVQELSKQNMNGAGFREAIKLLDSEYLKPIYEILDKEAEKVVSDNVGIVTIGTALSPYRGVDVAIVFARNLKMINRIISIYRMRPIFTETLAIFWDIAKVIAAVNILNSMDNVWAGIGRHVPIVGRSGEAISEGLFSGLFTSVAGHAAKDRCKAYAHWSNDEAAKRYRKKLTHWGSDVFSIIKRYGFEKLTQGFGKKSDKSKTETDL